MRNQYRYTTNSGGYVALVTTLILSTILMILTFAANSDAFIARANLSHTEEHVQAKHYAVACGLISLRIFNTNPTRLSAGAVLPIQLDNDTYCWIISASTSANGAESSIRAYSGTTVSLLHVYASRASSIAPFIPDYWSELSSQ